MNDKTEDGSRNVPDGHLTLVGRIASNWSLFETINSRVGAMPSA
jgi:hypothetical protein